MRFANLSLAKTSLRHATTPWAITTSVVGFMCDVLKPSGNLAPYLLIVSVLGFGIVFFFFRKRAKTQGLETTFNSSLGGFLSFFALSILAWVVLTLAFFVTPPEGVAAATIPGIETFQKEVLKIGQDVTEIKGTVGRIEEKLDTLAKNGTVIPNPKTPEEFYHNARFYAVKGNTGEAEKAYQKFLEMAPDYVDAHLAFQILINNTQGPEKTRQFYSELAAKHPQDPIVALMSAMQIADRNLRIAALEGLAKQYPLVGPVSYVLAQEYLQPGEGNITLDEMKKAKATFEQFKKADAAGGVKPYYIDKTVLDSVYKTRDEYDKRVSGLYSGMIEKPLIMKVTLLPNMVSIGLIPKEQKVQKILYSIDDPNPTLDTGLSPWVKDPTTGQPMPNYQVNGKVANGKHIVYAKYINAQGKESDVFQEPFEVTPIQARVIQMPGGELGSTKKNYLIDFQGLDGKEYSFFYDLNNPNPGQAAPSTPLTLKEIIPGTQELFYFGVSGGEKTPVYSVKLAQ